MQPTLEWRQPERTQVDQQMQDRQRTGKNIRTTHRSRTQQDIVSRTSNQSDLDAVRDATSLVDVIGECVSLKMRGREHVGLCPFHDDHNPSFAVVTHKGNAFYICNSCGASGDVFNFVMEYHKMDFPTALRFLADRAGITLQPWGADQSGASSETSSTWSIQPPTRRRTGRPCWRMRSTPSCARFACRMNCWRQRRT